MEPQNFKGTVDTLQSSLYCSCTVLFQSKSEEEPFQTTDADLAGFWDMVLLQVDDVDRMFNELDELRRHDWNFNTVHVATVSIETVFETMYHLIFYFCCLCSVTFHFVLITTCN